MRNIEERAGRPAHTHQGFAEVPKERSAIKVAAKPPGGLLRCIHAPGACQRENCPGNSKLAEQNQDQHDNKYEAEPAATVVAGAVKGAAGEPAKAPE